mgnify:CR=1 FL=1|jgi:hypothetical protein|nr:MAG TPA: hypothetical protein [Caudoviricetes sp.]
MKIGTKSLLYGAHCFIIHPVMVFAAWWRLYGFPCDPRLWVVFIVHDWGYWGKPNMDGPEGETHVELGAKIMGRLFGPEWARLSLYHSRYYARKDGQAPSKLCYADKLALCYESTGFYLLRVTMTGEIREYMALADKNGKYGRDAYMNVRTDSQRKWFTDVRRFLLRYVAANYK